MAKRIASIGTNVLPHFKQLDETTWAERLPPYCRFVAPSVAVSELDQHKIERCSDDEP